MITDPLQTKPDFHSGPASQTKPGVYWFQSGTASRAMLVEVREANAELVVWWPNDDQVVQAQRPLAGAIPPST